MPVLSPKKAAYTGGLPRSARDEDREREVDPSRLPLIVLQQSAQPLAADNPVQRHGVGPFRRRGFIASQRHVAQPLMRAKTMIVVEETREDVSQVALPEDPEMIETLALDSSHPSLGVDDVRGPELSRLVGEDHAHIARDLGHPHALRVSLVNALQFRHLMLYFVLGKRQWGIVLHGSHSYYSMEGRS